MSESDISKASNYTDEDYLLHKIDKLDARVKELQIHKDVTSALLDLRRSGLWETSRVNNWLDKIVVP